MDSPGNDMVMGLRAGGRERNVALTGILEHTELPLATGVLEELTECINDTAYGNNRLAADIFQYLSSSGFDIGQAIPLLLVKARDNDGFGRRVQGILLSFAGKSLQNARTLRDQAVKAGFIMEPRPAGYKTSGFLPYDEPGFDEPVFEDPAGWVTELNGIIEKSVQPRTLRWPPGYGVKIGGGKLQWFADGGGGYSQAYDEFLVNGPRRLWIDRAMPGECRVEIYQTLGAEAPAVKPIPERCREMDQMFSAWDRRYGRGNPECESCSLIPPCSWETRIDGLFVGGEKGLPGSRHRFVDILLFNAGTVSGCPECGRLYVQSREHYRDVYLPDEDTEYLEKYDSGTILELVLKHVRENEPYEILASIPEMEK